MAYVLLYGDAVAHLGIARRIVDTRYPGLAQLGGSWLPLPHLLMLPFVGRRWSGGRAAWPGHGRRCRMLSYAGERGGIVPAGAEDGDASRGRLVATAFYGLNANLLFLATAPMTEPLFLALLIWTVLVTLECVEAMRAGLAWLAGRRMIGLGLLIFCATLTRYDGWILGAVVWCLVAWQMWKLPAIRVRLLGIFLVFTVIVAAGPVSWFAYNHVYAHDWLDFMRGPYSPREIDRKTSPPGSHKYWGWHNPAWSLMLYARTAQVDAVWWELGWLLAGSALWGGWVVWRDGRDVAWGGGLGRPIHRKERDERGMENGGRPTHRDEAAMNGARGVTRGVGWATDRRVVLLLWLPLPFYVYSISYGSVPIFIPQLYPNSFYNSRYGLEMLPCLALFGAVAVAGWAGKVKVWNPVVARLLAPVAAMLCVVNCLLMVHATPLVLHEAEVNSVGREAMEKALAQQLDAMQPGAPIMMDQGAFVGALMRGGDPAEAGDWAGRLLQGADAAGAEGGVCCGDWG